MWEGFPGAVYFGSISVLQQGCTGLPQKQKRDLLRICCVLPGILLARLVHLRIKVKKCSYSRREPFGYMFVGFIYHSFIHSCMSIVYSFTDCSLLLSPTGRYESRRWGGIEHCTNPIIKKLAVQRADAMNEDTTGLKVQSSSSQGMHYLGRVHFLLRVIWESFCKR